MIENVTCRHVKRVYQGEAGTLRCRVDGPVAPLLAGLAAAGALRVISREPSLEELFLTHYGSGSTGHDPHPTEGTSS